MGALRVASSGATMTSTHPPRRHAAPLLTEPIFRLPTAWSTATAGAISVNHFEGEVTVREMNEIQEIGDRWYLRYPAKSLSLSVVYPTTHRPPAEQRERLRQLIKHWEHHHLASANVMLIDGLLGAMHRSVLTGVMMLAPPPHPAKVFASFDVALPWLLTHQTTKLDLASVREAVDRVSAEFLARPGRVPEP